MFKPLKALREALDSLEAIDLSHVIENDMPRCLNHPHVAITKTCTHAHDGFYNQCLVMGEHTGTHVDASAQTVPWLSERTIETFPATLICGPAVKYDLGRFDLQLGQVVTAAQILQLESEMNDAAGEGEIAILNFSWEKYWRIDGDWKYYAMNEPGLSEDAVRLFMERRVKAVGCDTTSCDMPILSVCRIYWANIANSIVLLKYAI